MKITVVIDCIDGKILRSDRAAVERAVSHVGSKALAPMAVCCPSGQAIAIRYALAAGARQTVALSEVQPGLVLFGVGGAGWRGDLLPAQLASQQAAHLILDVLDFEFAGDQIEIIRDLGRGERELISASLPVVLLMSNNASVSKYVSRYRQQAVELSTLATSSTPSAAELAPEHSVWQPISPRTKTVDLAQKTTGNAQDRLFATFGLSALSGTTSQAAATGQSDDNHTITDVEDCITHFLRYLAHHGLMDSAPVQGFERATNDKESQRGNIEKAKPVGAIEVAGSSHLYSRPRCPRPRNMSTEQFALKWQRQPKLISPVHHRSAASGQHSCENEVRGYHQSFPIDPAVLRRPRALGRSNAKAVRGPFPVFKNNK